MDSIASFLANLSFMALPILLAITLHEASHGYVANMLGDPTAKRMGRLSLNPIAHIDPFGTVILPLITFFIGGFIFGYAKPVPVNFRNLRNPKRDMIWVALAGPGANAVLALAGGALALTLGVVPAFFKDWFYLNLQFLIFFNCIIGVLNLMPLLPLDGGRVLAGLLPDALAREFSKTERYGIVLFIGIFFLLPMLLRTLGIGFSPAEMLIFKPACGVYGMIANLFGMENAFCP
jgi:Zn-dependent protease